MLVRFSLRSSRFRSMSAAVIPVALKVPIVHTYHGDVILNDNYHWLKDQSPGDKRPEILDHLKVLLAHVD